jgi:hypothetical protein
MTEGCIADKPFLDNRVGACPSSIWKLHGHFWLIIVTSVLFAATAMAMPKISKVRTGEHEDFARLVFELEGTAQVGESQISSGRIWLTLLGVETALPKTTLLEGTIRSVEFVKEGKNVKAEVEVADSDFEIKVFALTDPDRIVVDVFPETRAAALTARNREEVEPTAGGTALSSEDASVNSEGFRTRPEGNAEVAQPVGSLSAGLESLEVGSSETSSIKPETLEVEPGTVVSAGFDWGLVGLVALVVFLIGLLSVTCMKVLKKPEATVEKEGASEDFRRSVTEIDTLIKGEIRNYDRLRWRKQE